MRPKTKNKLLKTITVIAVIGLALGGCCLDSENLTIPIIVCSVSGLWLLLFCAANGRE